MQCYIVSLDLLDPLSNHDALYAQLSTYSHFAKLNGSTWALVTDQSALQIREQLSQHLAANDRLFIVKSGVEAAWRNPECENEWLKENL
jgi:hypothetical protein